VTFAGIPATTPDAGRESMRKLTIADHHAQAEVIAAPLTPNPRSPAQEHPRDVSLLEIQGCSIQLIDPPGYWLRIQDTYNLILRRG
jgi:hypothetical protein